MVVLVDNLSGGPPNPTLDEIRTRAVTLCEYADRVEADSSAEDIY
jgi:hypothetical protein